MNRKARDVFDALVSRARMMRIVSSIKGKPGEMVGRLSTEDRQSLAELTSDYARSRRPQP